MSIKNRILVPMIVLTVLMATVLVGSNILRFSKYIDSNINLELQKMLSALCIEIDMMKSKAHIASLLFSNDPAIKKAMESGNREELLSRSTQLLEEADIELCAIANASGTVLARPHSPEVHGDDITIMHSARLALAGKPFPTVDCTLGGDIVTACGAPIYDNQGQLQGVVVVGFFINSDEFVDRQKDFANFEINVYREDLCIGTTLLNEDGTRAINTIAPEYISQAVLAGEMFSGQVKILNREMMTLFAPIKDAAGKAIGMLFVGQNLSAKASAIRSFVITGISTTLLFLVISILIVLLVVRYVSTPIIKMLDKIHYDALTGIFNRRFLDENLNRMIRSLSRSNGMLSVMMIDIDFFKRYNDTYGHTMGDNCLKAVASALSQCLTRADDFVARYGGEEFVIILPNTNETGARSIANKLLETIQELGIPHGKSKASNYVTISIGVTSGIVNHLQSGEDYIQKADEMLYESKRNGRNKYTFSSL